MLPARAGILLALLPLCASLQADEVKPRKVAETPGGVLYRYGEQRVLVVRGTPRAMGLAHGRLLRQEVRQNVEALLEDWTFKRMGQTRAAMRAVWDRMAAHVPARYREELLGLAEGSGVPLEDLCLAHAIPVRYGCTGAVATPAATKDGKVYCARSLDYSLSTGHKVQPQSNSLLLVAVPQRGNPHALVTWAGFLGCVTGMNVHGVGASVMGSRPQAEPGRGMPAVFLLREALWHARDLEAVETLWREGSYAAGHDLLLCDRAGALIARSEASGVRFVNPETGVHAAIDGVVRLCHHRVEAELAAAGGKPYDPRTRERSSWRACERQGRVLRDKRGALDAAAMIGFLRAYPPTHHCLQQAVFCPDDAALWVSQARDPAVDPLPGAQTQPFLRYDLRRLVAGEAVAVPRSGANREGTGIESGRVSGERRIEGLFAHEPRPFRYQLLRRRTIGEVAVHDLTFPSPGPSRFPENMTVHAEYYRPPGDGPFRAVIVLHLRDGRFYIARGIAAALAQRGVAALFLMLPYYGERRPRAVTGLDALKPSDFKDGMLQGVRDVRRAAAWLRSRGEVDPRRVGVAGVSLGAYVAQMAAGADGGFERCVFVLSSGSIAEATFSGARPARFIGAYARAHGFTRDSLAEFIGPFEPIRHTAGIDPAGVLMVNCRDDRMNTPAAVRRYWEAVGKPKIVWYDGDHYALQKQAFSVLDLLLRHFE